MQYIKRSEIVIEKYLWAYFLCLLQSKIELLFCLCIHGKRLAVYFIMMPSEISYIKSNSASILNTVSNTFQETTKNHCKYVHVLYTIQFKRNEFQYFIRYMTYACNNKDSKWNSTKLREKGFADPHVSGTFKIVSMESILQLWIKSLLN